VLKTHILKRRWYDHRYAWDIGGRHYDAQLWANPKSFLFHHDYGWFCLTVGIEHGV